MLKLVDMLFDTYIITSLWCSILPLLRRRTVCELCCTFSYLTHGTGWTPFCSLSETLFRRCSQTCSLSKSSAFAPFAPTSSIMQVSPHLPSTTRWPTTHAPDWYRNLFADNIPHMNSHQANQAHGTFCVNQHDMTTCGVAREGTCYGNITLILNIIRDIIFIQDYTKAYINPFFWANNAMLIAVAQVRA